MVNYPSMKDHLTLAHTYWRRHLKPHDLVVDATAGNGYDTATLAALLNHSGHLTAYDTQQAALDATSQKTSSYSNITLKLSSHENIDEKDLALVVYNLGYLPGGDKSITTQTSTTLLSLERAYQGLKLGGALSIMCYPGHLEGALEQAAILQWLRRFKGVRHHYWKSHSPSLHFLVKRGS